jgi:PAS domain S-box-containing protein
MANPAPEPFPYTTDSSPPRRDAVTPFTDESDARFRALVQRAGFGIYRSSPEGQFLDVNAALVRMLGYASANELYAVDMALDLYADPTERDRLRQRLQGPEYVDWAETRWKRKDGAPIAVRLSVRAVYDDRGRLQCYEGIAEDVTERRRREELVRRSERMAGLGATLAGVAHELNNPLAAIMGFAQLLLRQATDEDQRLALETISHETGRAAKIVRDLLSLARKREEQRRAAVNLNDVVGYIARTRRYSLETHGITCTLRLDADVPLVFGDRTQLEQVVLNLLNNAEHAVRSERGDDRVGLIAIRTWRESAGEVAVLEVGDDGPGFPEEVRARIWDAFWTTKQVGLGTGLGLAVVKGIVAEHGGTISVTSAPGSGARFTIRFPRATPADLLAVGDISPCAAGRALDVLVVDSNPDELSFLTNFLTSRGHAALTARDGERALWLAERMSFDAVIFEASLACGVRDCGEPPAGSRGRERLGALRALQTQPGCARSRFIVAASGPETTKRLPLPLPPGVTVVMRPYDVEELRLLLED